MSSKGSTCTELDTEPDIELCAELCAEPGAESGAELGTEPNTRDDMTHELLITHQECLVIPFTTGGNNRVTRQNAR